MKADGAPSAFCDCVNRTPICVWEIDRAKRNKKRKLLLPFLCVNTYFDTICVHLLKSAYTCVEMRTAVMRYITNH